MFVNTSGHYGGQRAQLALPPLKENDTHCVSFLFYRRGSTPPMLNIYIKGSPPPRRYRAAPVPGRTGPDHRIVRAMRVSPAENNGLLGVPVFNASGPAYHIWKGVELAVSTFWPNYYQVMF